MVMAPNRKTVINLDMALYKQDKQIEVTKDDYKGNWVLRLGEMHTLIIIIIIVYI